MAAPIKNQQFFNALLFALVSNVCGIRAQPFPRRLPSHCWLLFSYGSTAFLEATGPPLGLFVDAEYETRTAILSPGSTLLIFTDGLTDSIKGEHPELLLRDAFDDSAERTMANLKSLVDPQFNEDDITMLVLKRIAGSSSGVSA